MNRKHLGVVLSFFSVVVAPCLGSGPSFHPDTSIATASRQDWSVLGKADWNIADQGITGKGNETGGLLVLNHSFQDSDFYMEFRCEQSCETGVLFRTKKQSDGSLAGDYVSFHDSNPTLFHVVIDPAGTIKEQTPLPKGSGLYRVAPAQRPERPRMPMQIVRPADLPITPPDSTLRAGEWNDVEIFVDANIIRSFLNNGRESGAVDEEGYGPVALYVGPKTSVTFRHVGLRDLNLKTREPEKVSSRFRKQRLSDFYYSWTEAAADFNRDGKLDIVSGPYIYYGPDYMTSSEFYMAQASNPTTEFASDGTLQFAADFTGDGWPDVLSVQYGGGPGAQLYVNPGKEHRRWDKYVVVKTNQSEIAVLRDVDGDGKPELVYAGEGTVRYAKPDPKNPTGPWQIHTISEKGYAAAHGIGVGDIDGDGRMDILNAYGWWQQPAKDAGTSLWKYHPVAFSQYTRGILGGSVMAVYDVNGDGHNDVVTSLDAHGYGLAWFEQKRDANGAISFVEHMIMNDSPAKSAGGVVFTELHGTGFADVDGDGIPDFIAGKRYFSHLDTNIDPDPRGAPVLYWYKTVRDPKAEGGAKFVPELMDNHVGAGSDILATDLNHDGAVDIVTSTRFGTFIYWGKGKQTSHAENR
ncbi:VCBS repeat-containing protein [Edaphobacter sp. 12200R-103]|uniref:FG-GAP repeat domain-containing protein n=1 Tax=Edaphobacter sp. 12200R-103 TaxID=2703788 RepID=UPI00138CA409|nr:VCBS repeat-containing protein [Edaphobacter sp. 12200R-103]QHS51072.1 DUF1080 domain-containing protein [Edaphobacter sp. 12200R-103]